MSRTVKFSEIREASPGMREFTLAGIIAESRAPANGSVKTLNAEIAQYEAKHGLDSDQLLEELAIGDREETEEILSWLMLLRLRERVEPARPA